MYVFNKNIYCFLIEFLYMLCNREAELSTGIALGHHRTLGARPRYPILPMTPDTFTTGANYTQDYANIAVFEL